MTDIKLRLALEKDMPRIRELIREGQINPTGLDWQRFVLAEETDQDTIVGCGQIKSHRDGTQELASIAVAQHWRRQGVAGLIIEHLIANHEGELYLMCSSRHGPLYEKYNFQELVPAEMPRYFRRVSKIGGLIARLLERGETLLVMKLDT